MDIDGLGGRIATARTTAGLTQAQLARTLEVSQAELSRWERGRVEPRLGALTKIAEACGVSIDWLVRGDGHETNVDPASTPDEAA